VYFALFTDPASPIYILRCLYKYRQNLLLPHVSLLSLQIPTYHFSCATRLNRYTKDEQCCNSLPSPRWVQPVVIGKPRASQGNYVVHFRIRNFGSGVKTAHDLEWPDLIFLYPVIGMINEKE
jgi:hypothetical protein